jgi:hypothetical protein
MFGLLQYHVNKCCCCTLHRGMQCWFAIITVVSVRQLLLLFMMKAQDEIHDDHRGPLVVAIIADFVRMIVCIVQLWAICKYAMAGVWLCCAYTSPPMIARYIQRPMVGDHVEIVCHWHYR